MLYLDIQEFVHSISKCFTNFPVSVICHMDLIILFVDENHVIKHVIAISIYKHKMSYKRVECCYPVIM